MIRPGPGASAASAIFLVAVAASAPARAEVHFLAKQYTRCTPCHYSPSGGSLLTAYGRSLSREEISTFGRSAGGAGEGSEHRSLYGLLGLPREEGGLDLGIAARPSHLDFDFGEAASDERDLWMRSDLQVAYRQGGWTGYAELGRYPSDPPEFVSREHWVSWEGESGMGVRVGRFLPAFGIRHVDHTSFQRRELGFDQDDQVYGIELSDTGETHLVQFSAGPGRAESLYDDDGTASFTATGRLQKELGGSNVLVLSGLYRAGNDRAPQHAIGSIAHGIRPIPRLALWTELDTRVQEGWKGTPEYVVFHETAFEVYRGVWLKFSPQIHTELGNVSGGLTRISFGAQFFPRTHWNLNLSWFRDRERVRGFVVKTLLLQLHLYL